MKLSQIELWITDGRLQRCARHRLHELALLEIELLHLQLALGGERLPLAIDAVLADVRRKLRGLLAQLKVAMSLLLFQKLLFHPLLHLKLVEASRVGRREVLAASDESLADAQAQRILLVLKLKVAPMRGHAFRVRRRCGWCDEDGHKSEHGNKCAAHHE